MFELDRDVVVKSLQKWEMKLALSRVTCTDARKQVQFYLRLLEEIEDGVSPKEDVSRQESSQLSKRK